MENKACTKCGETKALVDFTARYGQHKGKFSSWCKKCHTAGGTAYRQARPNFKDIVRDQVREYRFMKKYGITTNDYYQMLEKQGGVCAVCQGDKRTTINGHQRLFAVDHCHKTGKVRGLLCEHCNRGIGLLQDSPDILNAAAAYLRVARE